MQSSKLFRLIFVVFIFTSCHSKLYQLHTWKDFNFIEANEYVNKIEALSQVHSISIFDTKTDGNDFKVNGQNVFLDTTLTDQPNYYNYRKRAEELSINKDALLSCLNSFYRIGANEFNRDNNHFRFVIIKYWATEEGYLYNKTNSFKQGDTIKVTSAQNKNFIFKLVLKKQMDEHWFEYHSIQ